MVVASSASADLISKTYKFETDATLTVGESNSDELRVDTVKSGPEALSALRKSAAAGKRYDLAILDMKMPGMDGLSLARAIKADDALGGVRLVLLTSIGQRGHGAEASRIGIAAVRAASSPTGDVTASLADSGG